MVKKPFSIRVEEKVANQFKALTAVLNIDGAKLLSELIDLGVERLDKDQKAAYDALLKVWSDK